MERVEAPALADRTTRVLSATAGEPLPSRRAIVCFVEDDPDLIQQVLALRLSWLYAQSPDTDLVVMGPEDGAGALARGPGQDPAAARRPTTRSGGDYRYINAIACLNGAGAEQLDRYSHISAHRRRLLHYAGVESVLSDGVHLWHRWLRQ